MTHISVVAATNSNLLPATDNITAGTIGGIFFFGMGLAVYLLWRNMNKRLKRLDNKYKSEDKSAE